MPRRLTVKLALRALTIVIAGILLVLGAVAAQHAETASPVSSSVATEGTHQKAGHEEGEVTTGTYSVGEGAFVTLAAGCVVVAICCVIGLALLAKSRWYAYLARYLGAALPGQARIDDLGALRSPRRAPSLISLSVSRT